MRNGICHDLLHSRVISTKSLEIRSALR
jgi:hypothetical protein